MLSVRPGWRGGAGLVAVITLATAVLSLSLLKSQAGHKPDAPPAAQQSTAPNPSPASAPAIPRVEARLHNNFALFRSPAEGLPPTVRQALGPPRYGMNWDLAQRLPVKGLAATWVVPGRGVICLLNSERGAVGVTCATLQAALTHGASATYLRTEPPQRTIVGLAPDHVAAVVARTSDSAVRIAVTRGLFVRRDHDPNPPDRIEFVQQARADRHNPRLP